MAEHDIEVKVTLEDELTPGMEKVKKSTKDADGAFKSLGNEIKGSFVNAVKSGILAYAGFEVVGKITQLLKDARKEYQEAQQAQLKLTTALGKTSAALNAQADALGKKLIVDNDEITAVQAMLANYVKSEQQIAALTPAVLDLAAATGTDMLTAANMVARAIADDGAELGRYKIAVDGAAESNERIDSIIRGVNARMGGQAEAVAKTKDIWNELAVQLDQSKETWGKILFGGEDREFNRLQAMERYGTLLKEEAETLKQMRIERGKAEQQSVDKNKVQGETAESKKRWDALVKQGKENDKLRQEQNKKALTEQEELERTMNALSKEGADAAKQREDAAWQAQVDQWAEKNKIVAEAADKQMEYNKAVSDAALANIEREKQARKESMINGIGMAGSLFSAFANANKHNAEQSRNIARVEAGINTAVAITKALPNPIMVAFAAAMGIAQQIAISNAQFASGVGHASGGMALVGEYGPELVSMPRGASVVNAQQTRNQISNSTSNVTINVAGSNGRVVESLRASLRSGNADTLVRDLKMALAG